MNWAVLIPIIAQYGLPLAESLFQKWTSGSAPTQADFDALRGLASQSASDRMKANLLAAGIDPASPQGQILLSLASGSPPVPPTTPPATPPASPS